MMGASTTKIRAAMREDNERGMTLVELLVYMILLGLVLAIIGSLMINTVKKQTEVVRISESNNTAQTVISAVDMAVSNASGFRLRTDVVTGNQLLLTKTRSTLAGGAEVNVARCVGYFYDAATQKVHTASVSLPAASNEVRAADVAPFTGAKTWPILASGVTPVDPATRRIFTQATDPAKVKVEFSVATLVNRPAVTVQTTTGLRGSGLIDNSGVCWNG